MSICFSAAPNQPGEAGKVRKTLRGIVRILHLGSRVSPKLGPNGDNQPHRLANRGEELVVQNPEGEYCATNHQLIGQGAQNPVGEFCAPCSLLLGLALAEDCVAATRLD